MGPRGLEVGGLVVGSEHSGLHGGAPPFQGLGFNEQTPPMSNGPGWVSSRSPMTPNGTRVPKGPPSRQYGVAGLGTAACRV